MNLKNQPKESAYVKFILSHSLLPYKSARRNNQGAITRAEVNRTPRLKSLNSFQRNPMDIVFKSGVARFTSSFRELEQHLSQIPPLGR